MTRNSITNLEPLDPKIKKTFHSLRNLVETRIATKKEGKEIMANQEGDDATRSLLEYALPLLKGIAPSIRRSAIEANNCDC